MSSRSLAGFAGTLLLAAGTGQVAAAFAFWPDDPSVNVAVCVSPGNQQEPRIVGDGGGGAFVLWLDDRSGTHWEIRLQHVLSTGAIDARWPPEGVTVCDTSSEQLWPTMIADGAGGVIVAWSDVRDGLHTDVFAQHVLDSGVRDPSFPPDGYAVCAANSHQNMPVLVPDLAGGAIIAWQDHRSDPAIYAQRLLFAGAADPAWPPGGRVLCSAPGFRGSPAIAEDGAGGAFVTWLDYRGSSPDLYAQRVLASGALAPGWPAEGIPVCTATEFQAPPVLVSDGAGGAFATWEDSRHGGSNRDIYSQHILSGGVVDPSWPVDGLAVCTAPGRQGRPLCVVGDSGGVLIVWEDERNGLPDLFAQRVLSNGAIDAAWPVNGLPLVTEPGFQHSATVVNDGTGGAVVAWADTRSQDDRIYATRVMAAGATDPGWPYGGAVLSTAAYGRTLPSCVMAGTGGVIVTWQDWRNGQDYDIYAQRVALTGQLGPVSVPRPDPASVAALSVPQPNPFGAGVSFRFAIPRAGAVELAIFDAHGRRVRSLLKASSPAGEWTQYWDGRDDAGDDVQPGLYFARLEASGASRVMRVARLR